MNRIIPTFGLIVALLAQAGSAPAAPVDNPACAVVQQGDRVELRSPGFVYTLDVADGLRAVSWTGATAGETVSLGLGDEVGCDYDAARRRIWITGWKTEGDQRTTHVFLPPDAQGQKLSLTLGGFGMYDYREIDVAINGQAVGVRLAPNRWNEPKSFDIGPGSPIYPSLRFGEDNILVIQCKESNERTARMDELDERLGLPSKTVWPAQFEQYLTVGVPWRTPRFKVVEVRDSSHRDVGEALITLHEDGSPNEVLVNYQWNRREPVLHKLVTVINHETQPTRLMNVRLGTYPTDSEVSDGEQGFPVYLGGDFFMSVADPAGWSIGQDKNVKLRQYPGHVLQPGEKFACMEVVLGAAQAGKARDLFVQHVRARSRRVQRGHDRPFAIYDTFGANASQGRQNEDWDLTEPYVLEMLDKLAAGQKEAGYKFDFCNTHFWVDYNGDLEKFDPRRFPNGLTNIKSRLDAMGIAPGLWISSCSAGWCIGGNPVVQGTYAHDPAYENSLYGDTVLCRATDPIRTMFSTAFEHHIRAEGVRLIKCDFLMPICYNPNHPHLPGVYSTEAIDHAVTQTFRDWDAANPDLFIMLYWGYRSPWWLLSADTIFDPGLAMEAASPGPLPTLYARDGVTLRIDQGQQWRNDVPALGQDTLGIWLSDWGWNSRIGKDRWQEGMAMDLCRGQMLAQIWTDYDWLSKPERKQLAEFIDLQKAAPKCFGNSRLILGDVWKSEPYGYCCTDGQRAFLALNNCTWSDVSLPLDLNQKWGLTNAGPWDIYRWYPRPAMLQPAGSPFGAKEAISLRPFQTVLLEVTPHGQPPSLAREFPREAIPTQFAEQSSSITPQVASADNSPPKTNSISWDVLVPGAMTSDGGATFAVQPDDSILASGKNITPNTYTIHATTHLKRFTALRLEVMPDDSLPSRGPGRAENGNFVLSEIHLHAGSRELRFDSAVADYSQESFGGWPVSAAIDGNNQTGWQIDPEEGSPHQAIFVLSEPAEIPSDGALTVTLDQTTPRDHTLGRFRLAVTAAANPRFSPADTARPQWLLTTQAPASPHGGTLLVSANVSLAGKPFMFHDAQNRLRCQAELAGEEFTCEPVLHSPSPYPSSWQAWRIKLSPNAQPRALICRVTTKTPEGSKLEFLEHYIPDDLRP